jgi:2'-deoxynucleoside 5'-phosphate N-hydrolase
VRIYFAASIRGGREDAELYMRLVAVMARIGEVLTEHVASAPVPGDSLSDREIRARDLSWLRSADAVIAEATVPSLGVGYEIAVAIALGKPVLVLFRPALRPGSRLSAMVAGDPGVRVVEYRHPPEAEAAIAAFLASLPRP